MSGTKKPACTLQSTSKQIFKKIVKEDYSSKKGPVEFDWNNKWLKGRFQIGVFHWNSRLQEMNTPISSEISTATAKKYNFMKLSNKTHPPSIYTEPQSK